MVVSILLLQSCVTTKEVIKVPQLDFPTFPKLPENVTVEDGFVVVPQEYFMELATYKIKIESVQEVYEGLKSIY